MFDKVYYYYKYVFNGHLKSGVMVAEDDDEAIRKMPDGCTLMYRESNTFDYRDTTVIFEDVKNR
jgi:hypothetical protein